jgi:protein-tyrosine-phosphatase/predicted ATP-grasp superfamily ATP-dependent carboligase
MKGPDKVLVIGDDTRSFLSTVRSLGRKGVEVHVAPFDFRAPALASRYIRARHFLPYYLDGGAEWLEACRALLREQRYALVIPCDERALLPLCLHREELSTLAGLAIPSPGTLETFFDKVKTRALAESVGVPVAPGRLLARTDTVDSIVTDIGLPAVIKEPMSYALPELYVRTSTKIIGERANLAAWLTRDDHASGPILLEQMFPGFGLGVSVLCHEGDVLQAFEHHRAHELNGSSYYRKSAPLDPERLDAVKRMVKASAYTGLAMFEFKVNPADGKWILIEVNARPWGSLPLPVSIGVDFPYRLYQLMAHGERTPAVEYPVERYCRNLLLDMWQARSGAAELVRRPGKFVAHCVGWVWSFHRMVIGREHHDTLVLDDPAPGLRELRELVGGRLHSLRERLGLVRHAAVSLPEQLAGLAEQKAGGSVEVLFVCQGNINRSSYAELKSKQLFGSGRFRFASAGMLPRNRRGSPTVAIAAAARHGVDMTAHRSRHATSALLEAADIVIAFDAINLNSIAARYPHLAHRVHLLGEAGDEADPQILDPEGKDETTFHATYVRIDACLGKLARMVAEPNEDLQEIKQC